jgi:hypothetical protein
MSRKQVAWLRVLVMVALIIVYSFETLKLYTRISREASIRTT